MRRANLTMKGWRRVNLRGVMERIWMAKVRDEGDIGGGIGGVDSCDEGSLEMGRGAWSSTSSASNDARGKGTRRPRREVWRLPSSPCGVVHLISSRPSGSVVPGGKGSAGAEPMEA
jgi:hypothetical protein